MDPAKCEGAGGGHVRDPSAPLRTQRRKLKEAEEEEVKKKLQKRGFRDFLGMGG